MMYLVLKDLEVEEWNVIIDMLARWPDMPDDLDGTSAQLMFLLFEDMSQAQRNELVDLLRNTDWLNSWNKKNLRQLVT